MNVFQYEHIAISGMDSKNTRQDDESALHYVHLTLSATPSTDWAHDFDTTWMNHIYGMKRRAQVSGKFIVIRCALHELESEHTPELEKIVKEVNDRQQALAKKAHDDQLKYKKATQEERKKVEAAAKRFNER